MDAVITARWDFSETLEKNIGGELRRGMNAPRCTCCGGERRERVDSPGNYTGAHGWCEACTKRWYRVARPAGGPPPPMTAVQVAALSNQDRVQAAAGRAAECRRLLAAGYSPAQAALRLGVSAATARRYARALPHTRGEGLAA
jgi:hypothetical protein